MRPLIALSLLGLVLSAQAQGVYRIVGPDGKVTFSDQPPPANTSAQPVGSATRGSAASANAQLPFELRQIVNRFPVTLYAGPDCAPCNSGRSLLESRGIPFTEKTVTTANDAEALKRLSGDSSLPLLTVGSQQIKGYSSTEWSRYLDVAGYPMKSALPPGYRRPAASALVDAVAAPTPSSPAAPAQAASPAEAPVPVVPPSNNPAGIRF